MKAFVEFPRSNTADTLLVYNIKINTCCVLRTYNITKLSFCKGMQTICFLINY
jgi:hypothetical protein